MEFKKQDKHRKRETNQETNSELQRTNGWFPEGRWGGGWEKQGMGTKACPGHHECQVTHGSVGLLYGIPKRITLYANYTGIKIKNK